MAQKVYGIGSVAQRINEISSDDMAVFRNFVIAGTETERSYMHALLNAKDDFNLSIQNNVVSIAPGMLIAYGYIGAMLDKVDFIFNSTSAPQYWIVYAEINKSTTPNTFALKLKNNQSSPNINSEYSFRQDTLSTIRTGVFQYPLYIVKVEGNEVLQTQDLRTTIDMIHKVKYANKTKKVLKNIAENVTIEGTIKDGNFVCSTAKVAELIRTEVNRGATT